MEPTKEQIQWFWEQCGFKLCGEGMPKCWLQWRYPNGEYQKKLPPRDLNNLFKYAVPKVLERISKEETVALVNNAVCDAVENKGEIVGFLFWAIYKAFKD